MTLADRARYANPQEDVVYELRAPMTVAYPGTGVEFVFTHARCRYRDPETDFCRFDLLTRPDELVNARHDEPHHLGYQIMYYDHDVHEHVKLPPAPDDEMTSFAKALNTALADGARARRRAERKTDG